MIYQNTIRDPFDIEGRGLRTNKKVRMSCEPYNKGIAFMVDGVLIPASYKNISRTDWGLTTAIEKDGKEVVYTEHVLSAFWVSIDDFEVNAVYGAPRVPEHVAKE